MSFVELLIPALVVIGLSLLGMAVGVIFRGRSFKSCGCASIEFRGERIECPACVGEEEAAGGEAQTSTPCEHRPQHACRHGTGDRSPTESTPAGVSG